LGSIAKRFNGEITHAWQIGTLFVKNRIVMAAMDRGSLAESDGRVSQQLIDYYATRAKGGKD
jgi:2,4-dienoyl-CoA reductase-like NADH-dependent reductase (Old Yellow Enzyme family)